jgi:cell wall-associated NlpC family hydrolase
VRARKLVVGIVGTALACAVGQAVPSAWAIDPVGGHVTQRDVDDAQAAVDAKTADVESLRGRLAAAEQRLEETQVAAAKAGEAFNGARYEAEQAAQASQLAQQEALAADADLERQRTAYADATVAAYQMSPQLGAIGAISEADGVTDVLESLAALQNAQSGLQDRYDAYHSAAKRAQAADDRAEQALDDARAAADRARDTRDAAREAERKAEAEADAYAGERDRLIGQLARLQGISDDLAEQRQDQLEAAAAAAAAAAAQQQAEQQEQQTPTPQPTPTSAPTSAPTPAATPTPTTPTTAPTPTAPATPTATPTPPPPPPPPPPAPTGDAAAAIAFARAQLGEPYRYGATGPNSWDCSGLTMKAWEAGGKSLPHYSAAQYSQSSPITSDQLQPGDLLFWSDGGPSSIYHVAIYTGNGMMIHAPRPGKTVEEVSMYHWVAPNYFARP